MTIKLNTPLRLDHLAVWVADMDKTTEFLTDIVGLRKHPMEVVVSADDPTVGGMLAYFVDGNGLWLEMILPTSEGPGMEMLKEFGDGAIVEVNFEAVGEDYINTIDAQAAKGVQMLAMDGSPLVDGGRIDEGVTGNHDSHETGQRIAYWPTDVSCGTTIEIYELLEEDETNLLNIRESQWSDIARDTDAPRIDGVSILTSDIEKTAGFYNNVMGLDRAPQVFETTLGGATSQEMKITYIKASHTDNVWVRLVQPTSPGHLSDLLKEKGDGYAMEAIIEVNDIDEFYDRMKAKGITMVNFDGSDLAAGEKSSTFANSDDRCSYFPLEVSRGLRMQIVQRGNSASILSARDSA
ncbi:MAG: catechol 2,3-dioxygenase-like lactoylglutathione lyase family enzyme [Flavobacterium sp.]|jgi:catechol 2,3-dioxygenase-like lactoylglutathione lyase family enzyme